MPRSFLYDEYLSLYHNSTQCAKTASPGIHLSEGAVFCYYIHLSRSWGLSLWFSVGAALPVSLSGYCGILCCSEAFYLAVDIMKGWSLAPDNHDNHIEFRFFGRRPIRVQCIAVSDHLILRRNPVQEHVHHSQGEDRQGKPHVRRDGKDRKDLCIFLGRFNICRKTGRSSKGKGSLC